MKYRRLINGWSFVWVGILAVTAATSDSTWVRWLAAIALVVHYQIAMLHVLAHERLVRALKEGIELDRERLRKVIE